MSIKLIVNAHDGFQKLLLVERTGGFSESDRVVYDERLHGALTPEKEAQIGGLSRDQDGNLVFTQADKDDQDSRLAAKTTDAADKSTKFQQAIDALTAGTATSAQVQKILAKVLERLKELDVR